MFKNGISVGTFLFLLMVGVMACLVITAVLFPTDLVRNMFGAQSDVPNHETVRINSTIYATEPPGPFEFEHLPEVKFTLQPGESALVADLSDRSEITRINVPGAPCDNGRFANWRTVGNIVYVDAGTDPGESRVCNYHQLEIRTYDSADQENYIFIDVSVVIK
jgi:hypothetical protein